MTVLCNSLQIWNFDIARVFLQGFSEVLRKESIETLWCAESENPLVGELCGKPVRLPEVFCISDGYIQSLLGIVTGGWTARDEHRN